MNEPTELTALQRVALLLLNVPRVERGRVIHALSTGEHVPIEPYSEEVMRACRRVIERASARDRHLILGCVAEVTELLERQHREHGQLEQDAQIVGTIPDFLYLAQEQALPPIEHGSLEARLRDLVCAARSSLDITIPYISHSGVEILAGSLKRGSRPGLAVRILTLLTSPHEQQNDRGVRRLAKKFENAGATVDIRTPTDGQAAATRAIAVMHAKILISDRTMGYLGTANISKAGLQRGFEIGAIVKGSLARRLWTINDWVINGHRQWSGVPRQVSLESHRSSQPIRR